MKLKKSILTLFIIGITSSGILIYNQEQNKTSTQEDKYKQLQQITNSNSEHNGKWRGLCQKNSIQSIDDFKHLITIDPILQKHFIKLNQEQLEIKKTSHSIKATVYHRLGDLLAPTSKPINIPAGDLFITDGTIKVRMQCCNDYIELPPTSAGASMPPQLIIYPEIEVLSFPGNNNLAPSNYEKEQNIISNDNNDTITSVPEPSTMLMFGIGLLILFKKENK